MPVHKQIKLFLIRCVSLLTLPEILAFAAKTQVSSKDSFLNPLNAELNPICHLLTLLEAHYILHVSRIRVKEGFNPYRTNVENRVSS